MSEDRDDPVGTFTADEVGAARAQLLADAIETARSAVRTAELQDSDEAWYQVVSALSELLGSEETYALLRFAAARAD